MIWAEMSAGQKSWYVTSDLEDVLEWSSLHQINPPGGYDSQEQTLKSC
ncbi:hypothetical protein C482_17408 [Natrialba chahannaoensis JCM 10990]|uniref:Uncharacterized protein n=1 Tax=Natrialba chahannaoensis JCM 10990 TaxID=1227492 RepID=M0A7X4_9EURY|nr:hypothetical protein C482_17408 [Natrialba chahannaoensis JCM 10990]